MFAVKTTRGRATTIAAATALLAAGFVGITGSAAQAAATYQVSPATGQGGTTTDTTVTITGKGFKSASGVSQVMAALGVKLAASCGTAAGNVVGENATPIATYAVASATKIVATVLDPTLGAASAKKAWKLCVYSKAAGNPLLGSATWTAHPQPTVTLVDDVADGVDATGPTYGGATITITGTNFTTKSTVKVGGVAATGVKFVSATSLTATLPAGTGSDLDVQVTTEGGATAANTIFDYVTAINVSPSTGKAETDAITITGKGFDALFNGAGNDGVVFVKGVEWAGTGGASSIASVLDSSGDITKLSDSEIVLNLPADAVADEGAYTIVVTNNAASADGTAGVTYESVISSGSSFTVAPF